MTEIEWQTWPNPRVLLRYLRRDLDRLDWARKPESTPRKWRLFACACCRRIWHLCNKYEREMVEVSERVADGELKRWRARYKRLGSRSRNYFVRKAVCGALAYPGLAADVAGSARIAMARKLAAPVLGTDKQNARNAAIFAEAQVQASLVRDIFGNPFSPVAIEESWLTDAVRRLARKIYKHQTFECTPELAHQLREAGCINEELLFHCQNVKIHARGCWVIDQILGLNCLDV